MQTPVNRFKQALRERRATAQLATRFKAAGARR